MEVGVPKYLYHYTNLENLALILKNRTIRLNPLNNVDDMDEEKFANFSSMAKYTFISSWTSEEKESIPFWSMYAGGMKGVRIRLRTIPFKKYKWKKMENKYIDFNTPFYLPQDFAMNQKNFYVMPLFMDLFLIRVLYSDDPRQLYPMLATDYGNRLEMETGLIGKYKRKEWEFQSEWRYKIVCMPVSINDLGDPEKIRECIDKIHSGINLPFRYIDLCIEDEAFEEMEIMSGPKMGEGNKILLEQVVRAYCPSAKVISSNLKIR
ncbi:MAG TPA: DUF2971 domain-containing protein [Candidatus Fimimorpha excrementavium]|nr:DUF2971 domain-containing protein [Candidatus Fimimorpha excrementavium]